MTLGRQRDIEIHNEETEGFLSITWLTPKLLALNTLIAMHKLIITHVCVVCALFKMAWS